MTLILKRTDDDSTQHTAHSTQHTAHSTQHTETNNLDHHIAISFIVPIYNVQDYLAQCLDSILAQDVSKEIILVIDGSTDKSLSIALKYAQQYDFITLIYSKNEGLSAARNKGMKLARGEYIHFIDSDDYLIGNYLATIILVAQQNQADIVRIQAESTHMQLASPFSKPEQYNFLQVNAEFYMQCLVQNCWNPVVWRSIIKRDFLLKHQLTFIEGILAEDQAFTTQLLLSDGNAIVLESYFCCYHYRYNEASIMNKTSNQKLIKLTESLLQSIVILQEWAKKQVFNEHQVQLLHLSLSKQFDDAKRWFNQLDEQEKLQSADLFRPFL